ncbi:NADH-quinone oxidoreductase subunit N [Chlorobaculum limnaeum]|uniref:NADH-quinone oxidoreductase subunit N n=1 Tax=Chlorobaculum limnaeum TaxID=274537 RepID=A0A1D8CYE8_CHLLM|nr:NADH-quinone oxidoreductase subunit N [Chlorobaculum limnaeum]AOS83960.1 NADH-quinone oxidoreductase subunit N [Chlorobaculum limnaeum]
MFAMPSGAEIQSIISILKSGAGYFVPEIYLSALFMVLIILDLVTGRKNGRFLATVTIAGLLGSLYFIYKQQPMPDTEFFFGMYSLDRFGIFFKYFFVASGILAVLTTVIDDQLEKQESGIGEYYALLVAMVVGMMMMASSTDMLMMFLAMELVSLSAYVMTGYLKTEPRSSEAALKYLVYGAASSGMLLYGFSLIYGMTAETNLTRISMVLAAHGYDPLVMILAVLLILAGLGYKMGAVPFHFWSPDVYEGAPTPVTAYLSVGSKAAGFAMLMRFFFVAVPHGMDMYVSVLHIDWLTILMLISAASMIYGNVVAIWQKNVKRLLAYSSIAHAGYLLLGIITMDQLGTQSVLVYLASYLLMNYGAFYVVILIANRTGSENLDDYKGLGKKMPLAGAALTVFLISLVGLPPTFGFIGKLMIFSALLAKGSLFMWLALIGILTSVISLYYYMLIPLNMYLRESERPEESVVESGMGAKLVTAVLMILTIYFGLFFQPIANYAKYSSVLFGAFLN